MKVIRVGILFILLVNCSKNQKNFNLENLQGYWEIARVTMPDGSVKGYNFNNTVDFIKLTDSVHGSRKKLKPKLDGKYESAYLKENFQIMKTQDSLNLLYKTPYSNWKETILELDENTLKVINERHIIYEYKHYEPLNLD